MWPCIPFLKDNNIYVLYYNQLEYQKNMPVFIYTTVSPLIVKTIDNPGSNTDCGDAYF